MPSATPAAEKRLFGRSRTRDERWVGIFSDVLAGYALDPAVFEASASGGSLTALLQTAMVALDVDVVLTMGRDAGEPWRAAPAIVRDPRELIETTQSTYQLAPYLGALRETMLAEPGAKVALTGVACHIQAMRKLQAMDTVAGRWAREQVVLMTELACSSNTRPGGTRTIIEKRALIPVESVVRLRYREGGYPGGIAIRTDDGRDHRVAFWQAVHDLAGDKTHRCLSCGDWMSGLADVSVSDGDPNIFAASVDGGAQAKHGRVFVRTEAGVNAVAQATTHGLLAVTPVELLGLNLGLERKRNRRASYERSGARIPSGPIPGYQEELDVIPDEQWIAVPRETTPRPGAKGSQLTSAPMVPYLTSRRLLAGDRPLPLTAHVRTGPPGRGELRIRAAYSLVSPGTELHYLDRLADTHERLPLGYCSSGVVDAVGPNVRGFTVGDRVTAMGWGEAAHGDVITVPYRLCRLVPDSVELADAVVADLAATAVHAVDRADLRPDDEAAVVGAGIVGLLVGQIVSARGNRVTLLERRAERAGCAAGLGLRALTDPASLFRGEPSVPRRGGRCVFLCVTGEATGTVADATRWACHAPGRSRLVAVGRFTAHVDFSVELGNLDIRYAARCGAGYRDPSYARGLTNVTAPSGEGTVTQNLQRALDLIASGAIRPDRMGLRRLPLGRAAEAYAELRERPAHPAVIFEYPPEEVSRR